MTVTEKSVIEKPNNTLSDPEIELRTPCSAFALATTRPRRQTNEFPIGVGSKSPVWPKAISYTCSLKLTELLQIRCQGKFGRLQWITITLLNIVFNLYYIPHSSINRISVFYRIGECAKELHDLIPPSTFRHRDTRRGRSFDMLLICHLVARADLVYHS